MTKYFGENSLKLTELAFFFRNNGELDVSHLNKYNDWDNTKYQEYLKRYKK